MSLEIVLRENSKWRNIYFKKSTKTWGKNSKDFWHLNQDLLPPSFPSLAQLKGNSTRDRHGQEGRIPFPLSSQSRLMISSLREQATSISHSLQIRVERLSSWWVWPRGHGFPSSNQSLPIGQRLYPTVADQEYSGPDCSHSSLLLEQRFQARRNEPKNRRAYCPA